MLRVTYRPSTSHWLFPPIIMGILGILIVIMLIQRAVRCAKEKKPFFNLKGYRFFIENWDKTRLFGTLVLMILYFPAMELIGFLPASIIFIFLFNVLFVGLHQFKSIPVAFKTKQFWSNPDFRSLIISLAIAVISSTLIWFLFGKVFKITLP
ncbi:MAG: tripartite tricarboxylate transporter TctB family protein [Spirochaetales bacterium]|nr:tripartite tricarboxylate transporter TctB family protein [Spirochaetales bacterium]